MARWRELLPRLRARASAAVRRIKPAAGSPAALACVCALLWALFELPAAVLEEPFRPSGDPLLLASAWLLAASVPGRAGLRAALRAAIGCLLGILIVHRVDRAGFLLFMGQEPLAYDQLFLVRHLFVLLMDLFNPTLALVVLGVVACLLLVAVLVRVLLRALALPAAQPGRSRVLAVGAALWLVLIAGSLLPLGAGRAVHWEAAHLLANLRESSRIYNAVHTHIGSSPYRDYDRIKLVRKPDIYLFMVESYGRVMLDQPYLRKRYLPDIDRMAEEVAKAGWHAVSGFSAAPVKGGRSWLAEATLFMGTRVAYEAEFRHLLSELEHVPHLPGFLAGQGYHTVLLGPADRVRPGIVNDNHYGYRERVQFEELDYRGPSWGWGIVPDQYSLEFTQERVLARAPRPLFFNFHMITSHAPWNPIPRVAADWRTLREPDSAPFEALTAASPFRPLKYFRRRNEVDHMGELRNEMARRYRKAIAYDLQVITEYLGRLRGDALVLLVGDHQPPFIAAGTERFDSPVHVLARDPALLEELQRHGFRPGLRLDPKDPTVMRHEGFFSLLARTLASCCSTSRALPVFRRDGSAPRGKS